MISTLLGVMEMNYYRLLLILAFAFTGMRAMEAPQVAEPVGPDRVLSRATQYWDYLGNTHFTSKAVQPEDGKILVLGYYDGQNGAARRAVALGRLLPDLKPDGVFGMGGLILVHDFEDPQLIPLRVIPLNDGYALIKVKMGNGDIGTVRVKPSGDIDTSYGERGVAISRTLK